MNMLSINNEVDLSTIRCLIATSKCVCIIIFSEFFIGLSVFESPGLVADCGSFCLWDD